MFFLPHFTSRGGSDQLHCYQQMLCDSSARPHCPPQTTASERCHFYSFPSPSAPAISFFSSSTERTRCHFLFFSLKIPLDYHTPPPVTPEEMGEPRDTIKANISENHSPVPCGRGCLASMHLALSKHEHCGQSHRG